MTHQATYTDENYAAIQADFLRCYPAYDEGTLRQREYARLDETGHVYLDYTGGGLYAQSQLDAHMHMLRDGVWGNPHSHNPTSQAMTTRVEQARAYVLAYFNANPEQYDVIFTSNASGALKLVGEACPFTAKSRFLAIYDNHNSVNGIREFARTRGAKVCYLPTQPPDLRLNADETLAELDRLDRGAFNLFAFPGQSNFSGVQHDLAWVQAAQERGWHVLLDAAAFVPTNRLDLNRWTPDFVSLSFYKMFGYPTGIGALIARRSALAQLQRPWFAGGTITIASVQGAGWHYLNEGHAAFEDGTVNYLSIPAVEIGLRHLEAVGIDWIHNQVDVLTGWLLAEMTKLRHDNGRPVVQIYGPTTTAQRGGTIAFNVADPQGHRIDFRRVELLAGQANISLRTGCFCNPGTGEIVHELTPQHMAPFFNEADHAITFDELFEVATTQYDRYPSTIRISVGLASNFTDVFAFMAFLETFKNRPADAVNA
ncbi:MAG: aminotransferase class V-fold PLP-dependent enzyme, partial [Chloroflexota bacterium]